MTLNNVPTHAWIFGILVMLIALYYVRPDPITYDLINGFSSALLLSLRPGAPPPQA